LKLQEKEEELLRKLEEEKKVAEEKMGKVLEEHS